MNSGTLFFIGAGIALAIAGACIVLFNRSADERLRQTGFVILAAGLAMAALTAFAARMPHSN